MVREQYDFVIIGAGMVGAALAAELASSARVLLLEQEWMPGYHSTGRSAALYSALYGNAQIRALSRASRSFFDLPPSGFAEVPLLQSRGVIHAGGAQESDAVDALCRSGLAQRLAGAEALQRVPILRPEACVHSALEPGAFDIDVAALHQGYLRKARALGARLLCEAAVTELQGGSSWTVATATQEFQAAVVINAAGAWAGRIGEAAGSSALGLTPLRRTVIHLELPEATSFHDWPLVLAADESFYFKPDAGLLLASPADETPSEACDARPDELDIAVCVDRIETVTTLSIQKVKRSWAGLRTFAPDRTPVIGYDAVRAGLFWVAGLGGYGIQTAPAASRLAAALVRGEGLPADLVDEGVDAVCFAPGRAALRAG